MTSQQVEEALTECNERDIVAIKSKEDQDWFTGIIQILHPPGSHYNETDSSIGSVSIYSEDGSGPGVLAFFELEKLVLLEKHNKNI